MPKLLNTALTATFGLLFIALAALFVLPTAHAEPPLQTCSPEQVRATERWWFFGDRAALDFGVSGTTVTPFQNPEPILSGEGSTVVTDTSGQFLFWSNGQTVFDANHQAMPNGTGLLGSPSAIQGVTAFPALGKTGIYFVVTTSTDVALNPNGDLTYSIVDMNLNGGLGDVTIKDQPLGAPNTASEVVSAVPNADGTGFWVITYTNNSPNILAYEFNSDGPVTGNAVVSTMSTNHLDLQGTITFSTDLTKALIMSSGPATTLFRLLEFDATTGQFSEDLQWVNGRRQYSADFSPAGNYVYTSPLGGGSLWRYQIAGATTGAEVLASEELVGTGPGGGGQAGGAVRHGPDGRMYMARNGQDIMTVVNDPDNTNLASIGFDPQGVTFPAGTLNRLGLPQTVTGCALPVPVFEATKTTNPAPGSTVVPGDIITYTIHLENISGSPKTDLSFTDDLSGVVGNATYNNDASATTGSVTFAAPDQLTWQGDLDAGETADITYSVIVKDDAAPGASIRNVIVGALSTCQAGTTAGCNTSHMIGEGLANTGQNIWTYVATASLLITTSLVIILRHKVLSAL